MFCFVDFSLATWQPSTFTFKTIIIVRNSSIHNAFRNTGWIGKHRQHINGDVWWENVLGENPSGCEIIYSKSLAWMSSAFSEAFLDVCSWLLFVWIMVGFSMGRWRQHRLTMPWMTAFRGRLCILNESRASFLLWQSLVFACSFPNFKWLSYLMPFRQSHHFQHTDTVVQWGARSFHGACGRGAAVSIDFVIKLSVLLNAVYRCRLTFCVELEFSNSRIRRKKLRHDAQRKLKILSFCECKVCEPHYFVSFFLTFAFSMLSNSTRYSVEFARLSARRIRHKRWVSRRASLSKFSGHKFQPNVNDNVGQRKLVGSIDAACSCKI